MPAKYRNPSLMAQSILTRSTQRPPVRTVAAPERPRPKPPAAPLRRSPRLAPGGGLAECHREREPARRCSRAGHRPGDPSSAPPFPRRDCGRAGPRSRIHWRSRGRRFRLDSEADLVHIVVQFPAGGDAGLGSLAGVRSAFPAHLRRRTAASAGQRKSAPGLAPIEPDRRAPLRCADRRSRHAARCCAETRADRERNACAAPLRTTRAKSP